MVRGDGRPCRQPGCPALHACCLPAMGGYVPLTLGGRAWTWSRLPRALPASNQSRQVTITGDTVSGNATEITKQLTRILDNYQMPEGYTAELTGSYSDMTENFSDLLLALLVAMGLVYFVLAAQFESFLMPVIVMLILPVAFTGALFALPLTGRDLSMISLVSLIMLAGTVVNNSIILVEYIKIRRQMGEEPGDRYHEGLSPSNPPHYDDDADHRPCHGPHGVWHWGHQRDDERHGRYHDERHDHFHRGDAAVHAGILLRN